jgi:hypothetical protein
LAAISVHDEGKVGDVAQGLDELLLGCGENHDRLLGAGHALA